MDPHIYQVDEGHRCVIDYCSIHLPINAVFLGRRQTAAVLADMHGQPDLLQLIRRFLYDQLHGKLPPSDDDLPEFHEKIQVHKSVIATFYAPSDLSGVGRMRRELIQAVPSWQDAPSWYDCGFAVTDESAKGMCSLDVACVQFFLPFSYRGTKYPCALLQCYSHISDEPHKRPGMRIGRLEAT